MKNPLPLLTVLSFLWPSIAGALTLDEAIQLAIKNNPGLAGVAEESKAAKTRAPQAASPPDLEFMVEFDQIPTDSIIVDQGTVSYMVQQRVPFPFKLVHGYRSAKGVAKAKAFGESAARIALASDVTSAFVSVWRAQEAIALHERIASALRSDRSSAEESYAAGKASIAEPLRAGVWLAKAKADIESSKAELAEAAANLSALIGESVDPSSKFARPTLPPIPEDADRLVAKALIQRPEVMQAKTMVAAEASNVALAKSEYGPDLMFRFGYDDMRNEPNTWAGRVGISVPLWSLSKQRFGVREAKAMQKRTEYERQKVEWDTEAEVKTVHAKLTSDIRRAGILGRELVPKAERFLSSSREAYRSGKGDFRTVVDASQALLNSRLELVEASAGALKAGAELSRLVGSGTGTH